MSLVYQRFLAISLPTVAAFLSILWLRNRRKGRHLPADSSFSDCLNKTEEKKSSENLTICDNTEDTLTSDIVVGELVSSGVSELCKEDIENPLFSPDSAKVVELLDCPINQAVKEDHCGSEVLYISEPEEENYCSSEELEEIEIEAIAAELDLVKTSAEVVDSIEPLVEAVKDDLEVNCSIIPIESEGENRIIESVTEEIKMKKESEQIKEAINTLDLDKMKEPGQLADKLASLELDQMKIDERKSGSERDSANHSPSEIMLASPSISNFSDAHSEGSSDSGKGQSDVAISPSRTPAGGSSLAGDQAPSVYEFVLPQVIVGRLIGRHGVFLNEIKTQTHTNIFIKRHPDSNKLKVCAIEGTQQDIDKALAKIRQKFPLRRFPQLTLEKVSFVQLNPLPPLKPEDFHLQLVEGVNNDVVLSSLISAAHFFLQQPCHPSYSSLTALNTIMTQIYSSGEAPPLESPVNYAVCAAPAIEGWYRAQIIQVEEDGLHCTVKYLDYGGYSRILATDLRQIRGDLLALPFQAVECYLANVAPAGEEWSNEARLFVHGLTCGQILHAQVYDYAEDGAPLVYLYSSFGNQVVLINEQLVVNGFGVVAEQGSCCGTTSEDGGRTDEEATKSERDTE
ncbi:unnamed protein product [Nezara viridula]|uniref:Tudor domain-containing protein n=1 Tax=Nezara viridula TaxID=85310 RepID=A0A9P0H9R6_NEZVI|nr:unnamed protein product [Nezara viridula]